MSTVKSRERQITVDFCTLPRFKPELFFSYLHYERSKSVGNICFIALGLEVYKLKDIVIKLFDVAAHIPTVIV